MDIETIDHVTIYAADIDETCDFYSEVFGADVRPTEDGPTALEFDTVKINVHPAGDEFEPHAASPDTGTADFCLTTTLSAPAVEQHLEDRGVAIEVGPVERVGARGAMDSVYIRDPDGNLVEIAHYPN